MAFVATVTGAQVASTATPKVNLDHNQYKDKENFVTTSDLYFNRFKACLDPLLYQELRGLPNFMDSFYPATKIVLSDTITVDQPNDMNFDAFKVESLKSFAVDRCKDVLKQMDHFFKYSNRFRFLGGQSLQTSIPFNMDHLTDKEFPLFEGYGSLAQDPQSLVAVAPFPGKPAYYVDVPVFGRADDIKYSPMHDCNVLMASLLVDIPTFIANNGLSLRPFTNLNVNPFIVDYSQVTYRRLAVPFPALAHHQNRILYKVISSLPSPYNIVQKTGEPMPDAIIVNQRVLTSLGFNNVQLAQSASVQFVNDLTAIIKATIIHYGLPRVIFTFPGGEVQESMSIMQIIAAGLAAAYLPSAVTIANSQMFINALDTLLRVQNAARTCLPTYRTLFVVTPSVPVRISSDLYIIQGRNAARADNYVDGDVVVKINSFLAFLRALSADLAQVQNAAFNQVRNGVAQLASAVNSMANFGSEQSRKVLWGSKVLYTMINSFPGFNPNGLFVNNVSQGARDIEINPMNSLAFLVSRASPETYVPSDYANFTEYLRRETFRACVVLMHFDGLYSLELPINADNLYSLEVQNTSHVLLHSALTDFTKRVGTLDNLLLTEVLADIAGDDLALRRSSVADFRAMCPTRISAAATTMGFAFPRTVLDLPPSVTLAWAINTPITATLTADGAPNIPVASLRDVFLANPNAANFALNISAFRTAITQGHSLPQFDLTEAYRWNVEEWANFLRDNNIPSRQWNFKVPTGNDNKLAGKRPPAGSVPLIRTDAPAWRQLSFIAISLGEMSRLNKIGDYVSPGLPQKVTF